MSFNVIKYQNFLREKFFKENYEQFNNIFIESEGIIAGSSVLSVYQPFVDPDIDLDIYIHISNTLVFVNFLKSIGWYFISYNYITPEYDESFFKKNNILGRFRLMNNDSKFIDILIIADENSLQSVVKNFDLSICEIWYNGSEIQASDVSGINNKVATLQKEYIPSLLNMNKFTLHRIDKYKTRGFKVKIDPGSVEDVIFLEKTKKTVSNPEEWTVLKIYKKLIFGESLRSYANLLPNILEDINFFNDFYGNFQIKQNISFNLFVKYPLTNFTVENLNRLADQLLGIGNLTDSSRKKIRKKFYTIILTEDYFEYKYYPQKYKNYIKQYFNVKLSDIRKELIDNNEIDEEDEDEEEDDDEEDDEDTEDEQGDEEGILQHARNTSINMERIREIQSRERERRERERRERQEREERSRRQISLREREERERIILEREIDRSSILQELENYPEQEGIISEILADPNDYSTGVIRQIIKDYYIALVNRTFNENNLNVTEEFIQLNSTNISELKKLLNYYYQRKYYFEKIREIIKELREYNPRNLNISEFQNLITEDGILNENLKTKIELYYSYQNLDTIGPEIGDEIEVPIIFEGINYDENRLKNTCQDLIMFDEKEITEHLREEGAVILINRGPGSDSDILCFDRETLQQLFDDKDDGWFYACTGNLMWKKILGNKYKVQELSNDRAISNSVGNLQIFRKPYVKLPINSEGMNAFISARELYSIINNEKNVFYIEPKLDEKGNQISFTHTISWKNVYGEMNWVSSNHCQAGSNILVYEIKVCNNPETCVRSILQ